MSLIVATQITVGWSLSLASSFMPIWKPFKVAPADGLTEIRRPSAEICSCACVCLCVLGEGDVCVCVGAGVCVWCVVDWIYKGWVGSNCLYVPP